MTSIVDADPLATPPVPPIDGEAVRAAAATASAIESPKQNEYRLASGTLLRFKPVPPLAMQQTASQLVPPKPPMWLNPDTEREEENPNHPDYREALRLFGERQYTALVDTVFLLGVDVVELGDGVLPLEDDGWLEPLEFLGLKVPHATAYERKIGWLKLHVIQTMEDLSIVFQRAVQAAGVSEARVQQMLAAFRGLTER